MKLNAFQKKKLRALGGVCAALQEQTMGLSRGLSDRRGERMNEAQRELQTARRALDDAERYATDSRNERFTENDLPRIRERLNDAQAAVDDLKAEAAAIETQLEAAQADSHQSGKLFERLLRYAEA